MMCVMPPAVLTALPREGTLATLRPGGAVDGIYACTDKQRLATQTGLPYLAVELRDRTAAVQAYVFRDADLHGGRFEAGDLVAVKGRIVRFREETQIELERIARASADEADLASFLPTSRRDLDELDGFLEDLAREVTAPGYRRLLESLLGDEAFRREFRRAACGREGHHAYLGGLLEHTVGVATLAEELAWAHPRLDSDLLMTAAIVHDIGKTREFTYGATIERSHEGRLLDHIQLGLRMLHDRAHHLDEQRLLALEHCVLLHHGPESRFQSVEALALHRLNALDTSVKGALEHGL